jgi:hypothetical protein
MDGGIRKYAKNAHGVLRNICLCGITNHRGAAIKQHPVGTKQMTKRAAQTHKITVSYSNGQVGEYTASSEDKAHTAGRGHCARAKRYGNSATYTVEVL